MKKHTILILTLISIVVMVAGTAMTSNAGRSIRYLESRYILGKGVVFLFETTGKFTQQEMKSAFAYGNGGDALDVHCVVQAEKDRIACMVKNVNKYSDVMINVVGLGFWTEVPTRCKGFIAKHSNAGSVMVFISYSWTFVDQFSTPLTRQQVFDLFTSNGWTIYDTCIPDPSPYAIPVG